MKRIDVVRFLQSQDLSEATVRAFPLREARRIQAEVCGRHDLVASARRLLSDPSANVKLAHSATDKVAAYGLNLLPADAGLVWVKQDNGRWELVQVNTCRFSTPGCRSACLATSGQAGMEARGKATTPIASGRRAKLALLLNNPVAFLRILLHEIENLPARAKRELVKLGLKPRGWKISVRLNVLSDIPWEQTSAAWLFPLMKRLGLVAYDYTAYPSAKRSRDAATAVGLYLVDSVKETHTDAQIRAMARPVVVLDIKRGHAIPDMWMGRPTTDADISDARFLDTDGTVRVLRYKHVASCTKADAIASGFVKSGVSS